MLLHQEVKTMDCICIWPWVSPGPCIVSFAINQSYYFLCILFSSKGLKQCEDSVGAYQHYTLISLSTGNALHALEVTESVRSPGGLYKCRTVQPQFKCLFVEVPAVSCPQKCISVLVQKRSSWVPLKGSPRVNKISAMQAGSGRDQRTNHRLKHYLAVTLTHVWALILTGLFNTHQSCVLFLLLNANKKVIKESLKDKKLFSSQISGMLDGCIGLSFLWTTLSLTWMKGISISQFFREAAFLIGRLFNN